MIIGTFKAQDGTYTGDLVTLTHRGKLTFKPATRGADYTVTLEGHEVGAAWNKKARDRDYSFLSVKLDSPFLPEPVHCALLPQDDGSHSLVWNRAPRKED